jgi:hypothetical protein
MESITQITISRNKNVLGLILGLWILIPVILNAQVKDYKRYGKESGIIEYEVSGSQNGIETIYFENYGMKEAKYTDVTIDMFGMKQKNEQVVYLDGYWQFSVNPKDKSGSKTENTMLKQMVESSEDKDLGEVGMKMFISMGGEKIGTEQFLGKKCDVWQLESMGSKIWIWNYIPLKTEVDMMGMKSTYKAINLEFDVDIPDDKIDVPDDIEFKEFDMNNLQEMMKGL